MIKIENIDVWGFDHAIRGMRNPYNSWDKSDRHTCGASGDCEHCIDYDECEYGHDGRKTICGDNDISLMRKLYRAGTEHRKYARQIYVSMDITAPLYWWKEMDQYKIGTTTDSCSTMHTICEKEFTSDDFSCDHITGLDGYGEPYTSFYEHLQNTIEALNAARFLYIETKDKLYWWQVIQLLPASYNQKRTITMSYENVFNIIKQRSGHKLDEWRELVELLNQLPYIKSILDD